MQSSSRTALAAAALLAAVSLRAAAVGAGSAAPAAAGDTLTFKLDYQSKSELNFGGLVKGKKGPAQGFGGNEDNESAPQKIRVTIKGELVQTLVSVDPAQPVIAVRLDKAAVKFFTEGEQDVDQANLLAAGLGKTALLSLDARGRITGVRFDAAATADVQLAERAILSLLQFVLPEGGATAAKWETKEQEPNGEYTARYTRSGLAKAGVQLFKKKKLAFAEDAPSEGPHDITIKKQIKSKGALSFKFDTAKARVSGVSGGEVQTVLLNDRAVGKADVKIKLTFKRAGKAGEALAELTARAAAGKAVPLKTIEDKQATEAAIEQNELKDLNADQVFAELAKVEAEGGEEQPVYLKLKALFFVHPEAAAKAGALLGKAKADGPTVRALSGSLGTVGNAESQAALAAAAKARPPDDSALAAILPAMGELTKPLPVAEDALRSLALAPGEGDGASTARLALGTMSATIGKSEPARAQKIVADLAAMFDKSQSEEVRRQLLLALGNSSSPDALPTLKKGAADKSSILREAAVKALGQSSSPEAEALIKAAANDPDEHVKKAAADALANRKK